MVGLYRPTRFGGYSNQPGVRLSVRLSVRREELVRSITLIPFEIIDQKVRGKVLLNRIAFIDCNENS